MDILLDYRCAGAAQSFPTKICAIEISPDGSLVAMASAGKLLAVFELEDLTSGAAASITVDCSAEIHSLAWSASCTRIFSGLSDGTLTVASMTPSQLSVTGFKVQRDGVTNVALCPDYAEQSELLATSEDGSIRLWDYSVIDGTCLAGAAIGEPPSTPYSGGRAVIVTALHWLKSKRGEPLMLVASYRSHGIVVWEIDPKLQLCSVIRCISVPVCASSSVSAFGKVVVGNGNDGFDLYSLESGAQECSVTIPQGTADVDSPVRFIHEGLAFIGGSLSGDLRFWDAQSGARVQNMRHDQEPVVLVSAYCKADHQPERLLILSVSKGPRDSSRIRIWRATPVAVP